MIGIIRYTTGLWGSMTVVILATLMPVFSQTPTDAQRSAIRSECRSDYEAHCASVPPGGKASLQCLQKNMPNLSANCQAAVRAIEPPDAPKAESAPSTPKTEIAPTATTTSPPTSKTVAGTTDRKPSDAQIAAIRNACRSDYQKVCAGVPTGGTAALQCLEKNKAKISDSCQQAVNTVSGGAGPAAATAVGPTAIPAAPPTTVLVLRPMRPREELFVLRSACGRDVRSLCGDVAPGGGRIIQCLVTQVASLSSSCRNVLSQFAAQ